MQGSGGGGRSRKHAGRGHSRKHAHHRSAKHAPRHQPGPVQSGLNPVHVVAKPPKVKPPSIRARGWSPGIALCPAEAVAQCARLAGWPVTAGDVLDLYARCADGPSSGFTIAAALTAASRFGFGDAWPEFDLLDALTCEDVITNINNRRSGDWPTSLLLGVDLPGPHALTVAPDGGWWSWGAPFDPADWPEMVVEEAWLVEFGDQRVDDLGSDRGVVA